MDFGLFTGLPDLGVDGDEITDIAEANKIIKQKNRTIRSLHFSRRDDFGKWKIYMAAICILAFLAGMAVHSWLDGHGYGACAPYDCPTRE